MLILAITLGDPPESQIPPRWTPKTPKNASNLPSDMWFPQNTESRIHTGPERCRYHTASAVYNLVLICHGLKVTSKTCRFFFKLRSVRNQHHANEFVSDTRYIVSICTGHIKLHTRNLIWYGKNRDAAAAASLKAFQYSISINCYWWQQFNFSNIFSQRKFRNWRYFPILFISEQ